MTINSGFYRQKIFQNGGLHNDLVVICGFVFQLDNMDAQEQADRLAAAEALYMISTRVDKSGTMEKSPRISRKKRNSDRVEERSGKRKVVGDGDGAGVRRGGRSRSNSGRGAGENRASGGGRGRGGRGGGSSPRGRGGKAAKSQQRHAVSEAIITHETFKGHNNNGRYNKHNINVIVGENISSQNHGDELKQKSKGRTAKVRQKTKSNPQPVEYTQREEDNGKTHQAIGLTGAALSLNDPLTLSRRSSYDYDSSQALQSHGLVSGLKQVTLTSRTLLSTTPMFSLPSMNLTSFTPDVNLPSFPLEISSLQLSSQPTPNLVSLGDLNEGVLEDEYSFANRKKSEKFLPLKKRKLHNPSEPEAKEEISTVEAASISDSEERPELQSSPPPVNEPFRASFTVQAPPIITMQTLMEIKTALTADDDGDLPLHIAVVHENMRMVAKLIALMKIAGKGVDKFNKQQQTPLHLAVKLNFLEAVDILLKSNANVNAVDCTGSSCIHMAVQGKSTDCLTMLLERCPNADLNARNFDGLTPLHIAVDNGDLQQVETLLKYNADIDVTDGKSGRTALFWAAESNQKAMVELLLGKGANAEVPNYAGVTTAMAAQGRNLHGVLKLLGSVATDKFTEFDVKPSLESKPSPLYLGLPTSDNLAFSHHSIARNISLSKHPGTEVTCLLEPKISMETMEMPSNETKVFKNVFVFSQNQAKSLSEPSSPEVKMEVTEDKDDENYGRSGLMSLPESIFSKTEEDKGAGQFGRQRKMVMTGLGGSLFTTRGKLQLPIVSSNKNVEAGVQRDEQKSVLLHMVPSLSRIRASVVTGLASSPKVTQSESSNPSSEFGVSKLNSVSSSVISSSSSAALPLSRLSSSNDTVTLTNMQARLFQMLLKKYNIDPSNEAATTSIDSQLQSTTLSAAPLKWAPSPATSPPTTSRSVTSPFQRQGTQSYTQPRVLISRGHSVTSQEQVTECNGSLNSFSQQRPLYQHKLGAVHGNSHSHISENGSPMESEDSKGAESPLNLSTTSGRHDASDSRSATSSKVEAEVTAGVRQSPYSSQYSLEGDSGMAMKMNLGSLNLNPAHLGSLGKMITIDVHKVSDHAGSDKVGGEGSSQYEMFLVHDGQTHIPVTVASGQLAHSGVGSLLRTQSEGNVPQMKTAVKQPEQKLLVDAVSDSSHITSVSQKTAFLVRDYLTQQNQMRIQNQTFSFQSAAFTASVPSIPASVPTVLELAAENGSSTQQKHVASTRNPSAVVNVATPSSYMSSVSSTLVTPPACTSPVFLHQGQVIDLSRSKPKEVCSLTLSQSLPSSSGSSDSGQGRIIGFSGAVLSVVPSKLDRGDKRPPREPTPKEFQKKRGRKSQKLLSGLCLIAEAGLGKINSETDEKLKKFLDAKKSDNFLPAFSNTDGLPGLENEQTNGLEDEMEEIETLKVSHGSQHSEGHIDKMYNTVGIFSGNVQQVKVVKKPVLSTSVATTSPVTSQPSHSKSSDVETTEMKSSEGEIKEENIGLTSSTIITSSVATKTFKHYSRLASAETAVDNTLDCEKEVSENVNNYSRDGSNVLSKNVGARLEADTLSASSSKKSKKRITKTPSSCVKERTGAFLNKKEANLPASSSEFDSKNSCQFVNKEIQQIEFSGAKSKAVPVKVKGNTSCGVKEKEKNSKTKTSLQSVTWQEKDSDVCGNLHALSSIADSLPKHKKRQRKKRLGFQEKEEDAKALSAVVSKQRLFESQNSSTCDSNIQDLTFKGSVKSDSYNVFSTELSDSRSREKQPDVFSADVTTADDDDFDDQPTLVIAEAQQEMS